MNRRYYVCRNLIVGSLRLFAFILMVVKDSFADISTVAACDKEFISGKNAESRGEFSTPAWPLMYPSNTRCRIKFRARENEVVWITWNEFHLEDPMPESNQCLRDYVEVIVIDYHNQHHVSGRYCGEKLPPDFKTMQAAVDIIFQSSFTKHYKGFSGTYDFISEKEVQPPVSIPSTAKDCGGFAQGKFGGEITNPGYPDTYPESVECNWVIRVNPGKQIYINLLELELTESIAECANAKVLVIDGYAHVQPQKKASEMLSREQFVEFCGEEDYLKDEGQKSYMSEKNRILVKFTTTKPPSEGVLNKRKRFGKPVGFRLVWTEVSVVEEGGTCPDFYCRGGQYCIEDFNSVCVYRRRYCIDRSLVCDGLPNCAESDNSDEENCYSYEIVGAGASVFCFLVLVILLVICCQRRRNRKHLLRMDDPGNSASASVAQLKQEKRNSTLSNGRNRQRPNPVQKRTRAESKELKALPMNYHGYKQEEETGLDSQPFLSHNHLPQHNQQQHCISHQLPVSQPPSYHYVMSPEEADPPSTHRQFGDNREIQRRKLPEGDIWSDGYHSGGEREDIWQHRRFAPAGNLRGNYPDYSGEPSVGIRLVSEPPQQIVEFHSEPERRRSDDFGTTSDDSSSVRNRRPPPVPLKPILKTSVVGTPPSGTDRKGAARDFVGARPHQMAAKTAPPPPPRIDSKPNHSLNEEALQKYSAVFYTKPGKTVGFAPITAEPCGFGQRTPIPPPLNIQGGLGCEETVAEDTEERSPSPWHHRTKPTDV